MALAAARRRPRRTGRPRSGTSESSHITVMATTLGPVGRGRTQTPGAPSDRATPPTVRVWSEALKTSSARSIFSSAFVGTARTCRGCAAAPAPLRMADGLGVEVLAGLRGLAARRRRRRPGGRARAGRGGGPASACGPRAARCGARARRRRTRGSSPRAARGRCRARTPAGGRRRPGTPRRRSPRRSVRPHTSQEMSCWFVLMSRVRAIGAGSVSGAPDLPARGPRPKTGRQAITSTASAAPRTRPRGGPPPRGPRARAGRASRR